MITAGVFLLATSSLLSERVNALDSQLTLDGNLLLEQCRATLIPSENMSVRQQMAALICYAFVSGSYNSSVLIIGRLMFAKPEEVQLWEFPGLFCGEPEIPNSQLARIFLKWLDDHPESLHRSAVDLALDGWVAAFPCDRFDQPSKEGGSP